MAEKLFTYFGNKQRISELVWKLFGTDNKAYVEPFAGCLSTLLRSPVKHSFEAVNDIDCYVVNAFRAVKYKPDEVIEHLYSPRAEIDLWARHDYLLNHKKDFNLEMLRSDPEFCNAKLAAWWIWGINLWIGGGWCSSVGATKDNKSFCEKPNNANTGVFKSLSKKPAQGNRGTQKPLNGSVGILSKTQKPLKGSVGILTQDNNYSHIDNLTNKVYDVFERLVNVNILCGDWKRLVTPSYSSGFKTCAVFLDPPYKSNDKASEVYDNNSIDGTIFDECKNYFLANYKNKNMKIILCGEDWFWPDCPSDIHKEYWKRNSGYSKDESKRSEVLWCSDGCHFDKEDKDEDINKVNPDLLDLL